MNDLASSMKEKYGFEGPCKPDILSKRALPFLTNGKKLLDVGCGEGADSVFYAKNGFDVLALDHNNTYLNRLRAYKNDCNLSNLEIRNANVITYRYPRNHYDVVSCILVGCCMRRSEFEKMLVSLKKTVKMDGIIVMSLRNYLDLDIIDEFPPLTKEIEPNTYLNDGDCCTIQYYIEKDRLMSHFKNFEILYYYEGLVKDKYKEYPQHGDSYIICRKIENRARPTV
ncbi:methyltransferase domain-containing protein [Flavobacteriaceae bacterium F89]|uniref:Methyltransferase domain-containing protein n=1 Tax=Cerina litoralis TaxID=2874477 RepID=A0AAE3ETE5_9FLAO|nr:methyltransferase domain-containing protein [Cerina litoralis]MCG2459386.1 methyltransferase domain-containing protein [Cerina litoralis]